jgi:hypothetical protein
MNQDQLAGMARAIVPSLVAYMVGKGWIPAGAAADVGAAVLAALAAGWSIYTNSKSQKINAVANMPDVQKVVTTGQIANEVLPDNAKVVSK